MTPPLRVLALNAGSSSLKFAVVEFDTDANEAAGRALVRGVVESIGREATLRVAEEEQPLGRIDHAAATRAVLDWLRERSGEEASVAPEGLAAVGHRVVHGGDLQDSAWLDEQTVAAIDAAGRLAPLHRGGALATIEAARDAVGEATPQYACFDTTFHRTLPPVAAQYAIDPDLAARHGIRRYGFHGLAHRWMAERTATLLDRPRERARLVTLQLGAGCSAAAIDGGRSLDTTMGLTPLEGLMMATRSGDVDPALPGYLARAEGISVDDAEALLNRRSGLLGVSGRSADMRDLLAAEAEGDERAALAIEMFCYRVRKQIGAYLAALGGADAVVFGGGIGEHQPEVRRRVCQPLAWAGVALDLEANAATSRGDALISAPGSTVAVLVVAVDEELLIAREALRLLPTRS